MESQMKRFLLLIVLSLALSFVFAVPREMVVLEIATGTWCGYCPGAAMGAHDLLENGHSVAVIKNHGSDSFANTYSNARNNYYNITGFPTAKFDGIVEYGGGNANASLYNQYLAKYNQRINVPSNYTISAEAELNDLTLNVAVTVTKVSADNNTNVYLRSSITESNIAFNWFNQNRVDNVNRLMAPNALGTPINLTTGASTTVNLTFNLDASWQLPNLELVLFLQSDSTKEVLQGKKYSVPGIAGASPASTTSLNFQPTYVGGFATLPVRFFNFFDTPVTATVTSTNFDFIPDVTTLNIPAAQTRTVNVTFYPSEAGEITGELLVQGNFQMHPEISIALSGTSFLNAPPIAEDVTITGFPIIFEYLYGSYNFNDPDGDEEGETIQKWYKIVDDEYVLIPYGEDGTYRIDQEDFGYQLVFGVTPVDQHGMPGETVYSAPTEPIMNVPAPRNLQGTLLPPDTVELTWEKPMYYGGRAFVGYKVYRSGLQIATITNVNTLTFRDTYVPEGTYEYWVCTLLSNPMIISEPSNIVTITVGETSNEDLVNPVTLSVNTSPNPFRGDVSFSVKSRTDSVVNISIYNVKGQVVRSWAYQGGEIVFDWDGTDNKGRNVENGVYLYKVQAGDKQQSGKITKIR